jgi:hypothetical protein
MVPRQALEHPPYSPDISTPASVLYPRLKSISKGQRFANDEEVTAKATRAMSDVSKNGFQECFQKLYEHWQKYIAA